MRLLIIALLVIWLVYLCGCSPLSGIPNSTMDAVANAGGGCVKAVGPWGSAIVIVGNADKGVIRNGSLKVIGDCGGIEVQDAASLRAIPPAPGTITTIQTPATQTTIVQPAPAAKP